jgi:hypothetical protein
MTPQEDARSGVGVAKWLTVPLNFSRRRTVHFQLTA